MLEKKVFEISNNEPYSKHQHNNLTTFEYLILHLLVLSSNLKFSTMIIPQIYWQSSHYI